MNRITVKRILAILMFIAVISALVGKIYEPEELFFGKSPWLAQIMDDTGWLLLLIIPSIYILIDLPNLFPSLKSKKSDLKSKE